MLKSDIIITKKLTLFNYKFLLKIKKKFLYETFCKMPDLVLFILPKCSLFI